MCKLSPVASKETLRGRLNLLLSHHTHSHSFKSHSSTSAFFLSLLQPFHSFVPFSSCTTNTMATTHQSFWTFWKPLRSIQVQVTRRQQPPTTRSNSRFTPTSSKAASQTSLSTSSTSSNETVPVAGMSFKRFTRFTTDAGKSAPPDGARDTLSFLPS